VHAHGDGRPLRSRFNDLEVDRRHLLSDREEVDRTNVVHRHDRVRVPDAQVRDRSVLTGADVRPAWRRVDRFYRTHVDRGDDRVGVHARAELHLAHAGHGCNRNIAGGHLHPTSPRLDEAADPVAAHLGPASVGVVELHGDVGRRRRSARVGGGGAAAAGAAGGCFAGRRDEQPVGPDTEAAVAEPAGEVLPLRPRGPVRLSEGDEEVVAETVVLRQREDGHQRRARTRRARAAGPSSGISNQRTRGSR
jgi:hypothetical protein